ncbi:cyclic peptide export ABC transporter [Nitrospirillum iridis]|uniref:Putative ATP-binding cassette transporter n=1 Tax=Nitrospirillum iridis TaxID=765888 RepID=A0A7X0EHD8_9PROT|nr:cyclic peptide export ABC transporter [Nitrospirillum iridis]MBB6254534.1 putative ATP-binding cassette transporter [Nitrospirillum iridis]
MALAELLDREAAGSRRELAAAVIVSGAANAAILAVINGATQSVSAESLDLRNLVIFVVSMALYVVGLKYTFDTSTRIFEQALTKLRIRLAEKIAGSELLVLHRIGKARIFQAITQETTLISESLGILVAAAQSVVMVVFSSIYIMTMSLAAFLTILGVMAVGVLIFMSSQKELMQFMHRSVAEEVRFVGMTSDLIDGLKEIKLSRARASDVVTDLTQVAVSMRDLKIKTTDQYNLNTIFTLSFFYTLIGFIVFILPVFIERSADSVQELITSVMFVLGPVSMILNAVPVYTKSNRAAQALHALEAEINEMTDSAKSYERPVRPFKFRQSIDCRGVEFGYPNGDVEIFHIGPIELAIPHGEITMIIGGNGSGKTTLLKVLAGLYLPTGGRLSLDGKIVTADLLQDYRELFSAIYTDFHLFRKLYGISAGSDAIAAELSRMRIGDKIAYGAEGFSTLDLSTGQRKRVALAVTLLEDRPIMIFDEWAADQDPEFRRFFYEDLLPELRAQGKTLLIATHDDRFFSVADTVVKMELGQIQSITRKTTS